MHYVAEQLADSGHMCMLVDILFCAYRIGRCVNCEVVDEEMERGAVQEMATPVRLLIGDKISELRKADDEGLEVNGSCIICHTS